MLRGSAEVENMMTGMYSFAGSERILASVSKPFMRDILISSIVKKGSEW